MLRMFAVVGVSGAESKGVQIDGCIYRYIGRSVDG